MDYINQIITTVKSSQNPEIYYLAIAVCLIFVFYLVDKALKIATFILIVVALGLGFSIMQGNDMTTILNQLKSTFSKSSSGTNNNSNTNNNIHVSPSSFGVKEPDEQNSGNGGFSKLMSDIMSKF